MERRLTDGSTVSRRLSSSKSHALQPPRAIRERFLHDLPYYTGPYPVGYLEIEAPARDPRTFSDLKRNHEHLLRLDTALFSIYYPCELEDKSSTKKLSRANWLPQPRVPTCKGYAKFLSIPHMPVTAYIACTSMFTKLPAFRNARLAGRRPWESPISGKDAEAQKTDADAEAENKQGAGRPTFPVVILSHGLGGGRTYSSAICGDLASYGFVVVAMEHRDGSGARTYVNLPEDREVPRSQSEVNLNVGDVSRQKKSRKFLSWREGMRSEKKARQEQHYKVDYLFPKDNAQDTSPQNSKGVDIELRDAQMDMRIAEVEEAYFVLGLINGGRGEEVTKMNLRRAGNLGASSSGLDGIDWKDWEGRLSLENVTMMGHSFGGATTVKALRIESLTWLGQGILLDGWGPAIPKADGDLSRRIKKPILSIGSEAFMHWRENFDCIVDICKEAREQGLLCWMMTIRGSTHLSHTDFAILYSRWMSLFMKTLVDPYRALYLTTAAALEFLELTLPPELTRDVRGVDERLLREAEAPGSPDENVTLDHRPDEKHIAVRLRLDHELSVRMRTWWVAKRMRGLGGRRRREQQAGMVAGGLMNWGEGNEVWVHFSPSAEEIQGQLEHASSPDSGRESREESDLPAET